MNDRVIATNSLIQINDFIELTIDGHLYGLRVETITELVNEVNELDEILPNFPEEVSHE